LDFNDQIFWNRLTANLEAVGLKHISLCVKDALKISGNLLPERYFGPGISTPPPEKQAVPDGEKKRSKIW